MAEYKILFCDLDGTLLDSKGKISAENTRAISELNKGGAFFVPASGRSFAEIPEELKCNTNIRYFLCSGGAVVYDKNTEERISFCFPKKLSRKIFDFVFNTGCHLTVRHFGEMLVPDSLMNEEAFQYYNVWGPHAELLKNVGRAVCDFEKKMGDAEGVEMISLFFRDDDELQRARKYFSSLNDVNVASACPYNIELTYSKAGKGNALIALADRLGISVEQTVAVGDSENDATMIRAAGLGIAVSNAIDFLKSEADEIICSNDENAIEFILNKFFA